MNFDRNPIKILCPMCGVYVSLPAVDGPDPIGGTEFEVWLDAKLFRQHVADCQKQTKAITPKAGATPTTPKADLEGRIGQMLRMGAFVTSGRRSCTMCGRPNQDCMQGVRKDRIPCCAACGVGDTHPVPMGDIPCAEWAKTHGCKS